MNLIKHRRRLHIGSSKSNNTVYQADTDGFVLAQETSGTSVNILVGSTSAVTDEDWQQSGATANNSAGAVPIPKGYYWKTTGAVTVQWREFK